MNMHEALIIYRQEGDPGNIQMKTMYLCLPETSKSIGA